jgi:hypothetical protein
VFSVSYKLILCEFNVFHILCSRLTIQHIIQRLQISNKQSFVTFRCASLTPRPLHGHPQGCLKQRNQILADSVKDVYMWSQKLCLQLKC